MTMTLVTRPEPEVEDRIEHTYRIFVGHVVGGVEQSSTPVFVTTDRALWEREIQRWLSASPGSHVYYTPHCSCPEAQP